MAVRRWAAALAMALAGAWAPQADAAGPEGLRLDMGTSDSPVKQGWVQVTPATAFDAARGYGWEAPPQRAFDESRTFQQRSERIPIDDMTRDGVEGKEDLIFKVEVSPGDYFVRLSTGQIYARRRYMSAWANWERATFSASESAPPLSASRNHPKRPRS